MQDWTDQLKATISGGRINDAKALLDLHHDDDRAVAWLLRAEVAQMSGEDAAAAVRRGWEVVDGAAEPDIAVNLAIRATLEPVSADEERLWLDRARQVAEAADDDSLRGLVLGVVAGRSTRAGALDLALAQANEAVRLQGAKGGIRLALAHQALGRIRFFRFEYDEAAEALDTATALFLANDQALGAATLWHVTASVHLLAGRPQLALDLARRHIAEADRLGFLATVPNLRLIEAGALKHLGDIDGALEVVTTAAAEGAESSPGISRMARATKGVILVHAGRWDEARQVTEAVVADAIAIGDRQGAAVFGSAMLPIHARDGDRRGFDEVLAACLRVEAHVGFVEPDMPDMAETAAMYWIGPDAARDDLGRAAEALAYAARFYEGRGPRSRADQVHRLLADLARRSAPLPIGRWKLTNRIGAGAMGEVWRAYDGDTGEEVAVKLLSTGEAISRRIDLVDNEIRAVAALEHPNIVALLGAGRVPTYIGDLTDGRVAPGSSYMALEYVEGTTLDPWRGRMRWPELKQTLLRLLDALAHAHAHGVLHLDVKPENVLVDRDGRIKLTDFGVARALEAGRPTLFAGTPAFMAPEQFSRSWRDFGPWTDLYALGGVAWALATGTQVFGNLTIEGARDAHVNERPPEFAPRVDVPPAFEGWVRRLLHKAPRARFRRAADAAYALVQLEGSSGGGATGPIRSSSTPTISPDSAFLPPPASTAPTRIRVVDGSPTLVLPPLDGDLPTPTKPDDAAMPPASPPPFPESWRRPARGAPSAAGLRLLALRHRPVVGRVHERGLLWAALRSAVVQGRSSAIVLTGAPGLGRTALVRWLAQRAHEIGSATVLSTHRTDADPIASLLHRALGSEGLLGHPLGERIDRRVADLGGVAEGRGRLRRALTPGAPLADRVVGAAWLVGQLARFRPVLLVLDDLHNHPDLGVLARTLVALHVPLVVLGTGLDLDADFVDRLDPMLLELRPLAADQMQQLVQDMVPLEDGICRAIVDASAGNPHLAELAVQLLVEREAVVQENRRLVLRLGLRADPPADLLAAWSERITRLGERYGTALRDAATLGPSFHADDWARPEGLEAAALDLNLLVRRGDRLAFTHDVARKAAAG